jgi:hypothetical protein
MIAGQRCLLTTSPVRVACSLVEGNYGSPPRLTGCARWIWRRGVLETRRLEADEA